MMDLGSGHFDKFSINVRLGVFALLILCACGLGVGLSESLHHKRSRLSATLAGCGLFLVIGGLLVAWL